MYPSHTYLIFQQIELDLSKQNRKMRHDRAFLSTQTYDTERYSANRKANPLTITPNTNATSKSCHKKKESLLYFGGYYTLAGFKAGNKNPRIWVQHMHMNTHIGKLYSYSFSELQEKLFPSLYQKWHCLLSTQFPSHQ